MSGSGHTRSELAADWRLLAFGTLASLASAPGQTLVISLFNADMREAFGLTHGGFGTLYMAATLTSAAVILWSGKLVDLYDLRVVFAVTTLGLAAACVIAGSAGGVAGLLVALFLLRQFGQGLMSHISVTSVNRYYETVRGKASAIVNQGFTLAEAVLPITISSLILAVGWRTSWLVLGALCAGVVLPLLLVLIADHRRRHGRYLDRMAILDGPRPARKAPPPPRRSSGRARRCCAMRASTAWCRWSWRRRSSTPGLMFHHQHITSANGWPLDHLVPAAVSLCGGLHRSIAAGGCSRGQARRERTDAVVRTAHRGWVACA
jgi:MFS family permease